MSDVSVASDASPPPAPAPAPASEVPVNPNPVTAPAPIGSQAPQKPAGETTEPRPQSRREAIQRAFERAEASRPKPEPAKARMGHNQPPEETKVERENAPDTKTTETVKRDNKMPEFRVMSINAGVAAESKSQMS